jgi:hypothetical protein
MPPISEETRAPDLLGSWIARIDRKATWSLRRNDTAAVAGIRFAFYARMSTDRFQDLATSVGWQRAMADDLIAGHGTIVGEYIDQGFTRSSGWTRRPEAAKLLTAVRDPRRGFDAIVVGEFERPERTGLAVTG